MESMALRTGRVFSAFGGTVLFAAGAVACWGESGSKPLPSDTALQVATATPTEISPPTRNPWISPDTGRFEAHVWDDRPISAAQKAEDPRYDPRWKPFSDCMVAEGFDIRSDPAKPFSQKDLDALVEQANRELPDPGLNRTIGSDIADIQGYAGAFLRCGYWLALRPDEWAPHGIERLGPGESPEP